MDDVAIKLAKLILENPESEFIAECSSEWSTMFYNGACLRLVDASVKRFVDSLDFDPEGEDVFYMGEDDEYELRMSIEEKLDRENDGFTDEEVDAVMESLPWKKAVVASFVF